MAVQLDPLPAQHPILHASGLYWKGTQELRLDVKDSRQSFPQRVASGNFTPIPGGKTYWVAEKLRPNGKINFWTAKIKYKQGDKRVFPYTGVKIWLSDLPGSKHQANVEFIGGPPHEVIKLPKRKDFYRQVHFVFAASEGPKIARWITEIDTKQYDRARWKPKLPAKISVLDVFKSAGFGVKVTYLPQPVQLSYAGKDERWSLRELHNAMEAFWTSPSSRDDHRIWVLFTKFYKEFARGSGIAGIMFDTKGPPFRQGCAIFDGGFAIKPTEYNDQRERFITTCHEIGHCFNLAHSHVEIGGVAWLRKWPYKRKEGDALSFMRDAEGEGINLQPTEKLKFDYRFSGSDQGKGRELIFLRHAPEDFVYPSKRAPWYVDRLRKPPEACTKRGLKLELRVNRPRSVFEFMEPVTLELKLTNKLNKSKDIENDLLSSPYSRFVFIAREDQRTVQIFRPFARVDRTPRIRNLGTNESIYEPLSVSAGINGNYDWFIDKPGKYTIWVVVCNQGERIISEALEIEVRWSDKYSKEKQEKIARDFFSEDVARFITFRGSRQFEGPCKLFEEIRNEAPNLRVALHTQWSLGKNIFYEDKVIRIPKDQPTKVRVDTKPAEPDKAKPLLAEALVAQNGMAIESFGHIEYRECAEFYSRWRYEKGDKIEAKTVQKKLLQTMKHRLVGTRQIRPEVINDVEGLLEFYKTNKDLKELDDWREEVWKPNHPQ